MLQIKVIGVLFKGDGGLVPDYALLAETGYFM